MNADKKHGSGSSSEVPSIISNGVRIVGDLTSDGEVHIDGIVDGDVRAKSIMVSQSGTVSGAIFADTVRIEGQVNGQITGQAVSLAVSARVKGDIAHDTLSVEQGAHFQGLCQPAAEAKVQAKVAPEIKPALSEGSGVTPSGLPATKPEGGDPPKGVDQAA